MRILSVKFLLQSSLNQTVTPRRIFHNSDSQKALVRSAPEWKRATTLDPTTKRINSDRRGRIRTIFFPTTNVAVQRSVLGIGNPGPSRDLNFEQNQLSPL